MLTKIDHFLLDRVFQRLADLLAAIVTAPVLAESLLVGAGVMTLGQVAADIRAEGLEPGTLFFGALNLMGAVWLIRWYRAHGGWKTGAANPLRVMPVWMLLRVFSVFDLLVAILLPLTGVRAIGSGPFAIPISSGSQADLFSLVASLLSTAGLYFAACAPPPPPRRVPDAVRNAA